MGGRRDLVAANGNSGHGERAYVYATPKRSSVGRRRGGEMDGSDWME